MSAAMAHSHRNSCKETAVVLTEASEIAEEVHLVLPSKGAVAECAPVMVSVTPVVDGGWRILSIVKGMYMIC